MLKKILFTGIFCLFSFAAFADSSQPLRRALTAPEKAADDVQKLTAYLTKPFKDDYDKLQVIAYWIASHIAYDGYKYNGEKINRRDINYQYDVLKARAGICTDFANLFKNMADIAGVKKVEIVSGYVLENQTKLQRRYLRRKMPEIGHSWNRAEIDGRKFFIDTTFMAQGIIGQKGQRSGTSRHKSEIKKRSRGITEINSNINMFYFDFTPKQELNRFHNVHVCDKYIENN